MNNSNIEPKVSACKPEFQILFGLFVVVVVSLPLTRLLSDSPVLFVLAMWLVGAGALGLLSGFTTGASSQAGTAAEFLKFLSGGIVVPILGAVAALLQQRQKTVESFTYTGDQITEKVTEVTIPSQFAEFHPLWVLGSFLFAYGFLAVLGIVLGVSCRNKKFMIKLTS